MKIMAFFNGVKFRRAIMLIAVVLSVLTPYKFINDSMNLPDSLLKNFSIPLAEANAGAQLAQEKTKQIENADLKTEEEVKVKTITEEAAFFNKAIILQEPQIIDGVDYSNLSIQDALKRMLEVNPDLKITSLLADKSLLRIKQVKRESWLPTVTVIGGALAPLDLISDKNKDKGAYTGERLGVLFILDSDALDRINRAKGSYEVELAKIKEATTRETRKLIETYLRVALAQESFKICRESFKEAEAQLEQMKKNHRYSKLDILQAEYFLARIFEKKLVAYGRLKTAQRDLKVLLGLQEQRGLMIGVIDLPQTIEQAKNLVEEADLRQPECSIEVMKKKLEEAKLTEKIERQPRIKVIVSLAGSSSQGTEETQATTGVFATLGVDILINDFGFSSSLKEEKRIVRQISLLELLKEEEDLENSDIKRNSELINLDKRTQMIRDYMIEMDKTLNFLRERVGLPISVLLKRNDQFIEARYLLRETLRDYIFTMSKMSDRKISPEKTLPEYQGLTLEVLLTLVEKNKIIEEYIAEKRVELEENCLRTAKMSNNPILRGGLSIENESCTDGASENTTKVYMSLDGRLNNKRLKYAIDAARISLEHASNQAKLLNNEKYIILISNYLRAVQIKRRITILKQIVDLKNQTIEEMLEGIKGEFSKYTETDVRPLILEQLESNLALTKWEIELFIAKFNIKKWTGMPLTENISLEETIFFDTEEGIKDFLDIIRARILPFYDAEALVKSALNVVDEYKAKEAKTTAFKGIFWQIMAEARGDEFDGWLNPNTQIGICFSLPFWGEEKRKIDEYDETKDKLRAQLNYVKTQKDLQELRAQISTRHEALKAMLGELKRERENLKTQLKIIEEFVNMKLKSSKDLREAKMRILSLQLDYEDKLQAYFYTSAEHMLILEMDNELPQKDNKFILTNLQDTIELALENRKEVQIYQNLLDAERNVLHYYRKFYLEGSATGYCIREDTKENPDETRDVEAFIALANFDVNLINNFMREEQNKKTKLAEMDLERAKFKVILEVTQAYTNYLEAVTTLSAVNKRYLKEKERLISLINESKTKMTTRMDYLRQEQTVRMLQQKLLSIRKDCADFKNHLAIVVGKLDPRFSVMDLEIYDDERQLIKPAGVEDIKQKLMKELSQLRGTLIESVANEAAQYGELEVDVAILELKKAAKKIKSLLINTGYVYLTGELGEIALFEQERLALPLMAGKDSQLLREFISLNVSCKIYDSTTNVKSEIKAIDRDIAKEIAKKNLVTIIQEAQILLDEYEIAIINYQYATEEVLKTERDMKTKLEFARKNGKLSVIEEMEIVEFLIRSSSDRIKAFYEVVNKKCRIDEYLKRYTGQDKIILKK